MRILSLSFIAIFAIGLGSGCSSSLGSSDGGTGGSATGTGGSGTGTGGTGGQGGGVMTCSSACGSGKICVGTGTEGGALIMPNDAGVCPSGRHRSGDTCVTDLSYACMTIPAGCGGTVTCACAASLCPASHMCGGPSDGALTCIEAVP